MVIPELSLAVMSASEPHTYGASPSDWAIDTMQYVDLGKLAVTTTTSFAFFIDPTTKQMHYDYP